MTQASYEWTDDESLETTLYQNGSIRNRWVLTTNDPYWHKRMDEFDILPLRRDGTTHMYILARRNVKFQKWRELTPRQKEKLERRAQRLHAKRLAERGES